MSYPFILLILSFILILEIVSGTVRLSFFMESFVMLVFSTHRITELNEIAHSVLPLVLLNKNSRHYSSFIEANVLTSWFSKSDMTGSAPDWG
jgi:hypothetical protein